MPKVPDLNELKSKQNRHEITGEDVCDLLFYAEALQGENPGPCLYAVKGLPEVYTQELTVMAQIKELLDGLALSEQERVADWVSSFVSNNMDCYEAIKHPPKQREKP